MLKFNFFQWMICFIFSLFMGIMAHATYKAYARTSGSTGQDIVFIQKTRLEIYEAKQKASTTHTKP